MRWLEDKGVNGDGDRFHCYDLIEDDSRIVATIFASDSRHDYECEILLDLGTSNRHYCTLEAAQSYCEAAVIVGLPRERKILEDINAAADPPKSGRKSRSLGFPW